MTTTKKHECVYSKAFHYAVVYGVIIVLAAAIGVANQYFQLNITALDDISVGVLILPAVPFKEFLFNSDMLIYAGDIPLPTEKGLLVTHAIWFTFFYFVYLTYLKFVKK